MEKVNYIIHLNTAFEHFNNDIRIKQGHITLYLAFFQKWNREFFKETITINRGLIMENAKIKSKTTYHNYLKDLNEWGYLQYYPSYHPARGSRIRLFKFGTSTETSTNTSNGTSTGQIMASCVPKPGQKLVSSYKHKTKENFNKLDKLAKPENELEVLLFFKEKNWSAIEGKKFFSYFQAKNWEPNSGFKIKNWKETAKNFIEKGFKIKEEYTSPVSGFVDKLRVKSNKNYDEPL